MATVRKKAPQATTPQAIEQTVEVNDPIPVPPGYVAVWADGATTVCVGGDVCETVGDGIIHVPASGVAELVEAHGFQIVEG